MTIDIHYLIEPGIAALLAFVGAWAALRVTVAGMKEDVAALKGLVAVVEVLKAKLGVTELETEKQRQAMHATRTQIQDILIRVGRQETMLDEMHRREDREK